MNATRISLSMVAAAVVLLIVALFDLRFFRDAHHWWVGALSLASLALAVAGFPLYVGARMVGAKQRRDEYEAARWAKLESAVMKSRASAPPAETEAR